MRGKMKKLTRRDMLKTTAAAGLLSLAAPVMVSCSSSASASEPAPVILGVPFGPVAAKQMGQTVLGYELYIGKTLSLGLTVSRVEILKDGPAGAVVKVYEGSELTACIAPKVTPFLAEDAVFNGQDYMILLAWPLLNTTEAVPSRLYHRVYFTNGTMAEGGNVSVSTGPTLIAPPVGGDRWHAANGPSNFDRHHRLCIFNLNGNSSIVQRFAVDWIQLGPADGRMFTGDGLRNTDWYCYNADLLAVADGTVIEARDGLPENVPGPTTVLTTTMQNIFGNCVIIDIGSSRFAAYAHLIPGSLRVGIGDNVTKGQVIGKLGNTGNSTAPHLHFHICNGKDGLFSEGLPFTFASYDLLGSITLQDAIAGTPWSPSTPPQTRTQEMPLLDQIVRLS
jgi:murein DD-endopeptidase MepM/ murein hydrolase activator NlpD